MSRVLEELSLRDIVLLLGGAEWRKRLENRLKTNSQIFGDYLNIIKASKSYKWFKETERLLNQFRNSLGEQTPTLELFTVFFQGYAAPRIRMVTRARYYYVFSAFFKWYDGSSLPFKVKAPKSVPQKVFDEEVDKLKAAICGRKTHKKLIERDILIIDVFCHAGLRLADLANLRVTDLRLSGKSPYLKVLEGKGSKDRDVNLNPYICGRLLSFTQGMAPEAKVFGLASKSVQSMFLTWAVKAGVPQLHAHSMRHKFATDIISSGGSVRDVQHLLGHVSLATTEAYLAVTDEGMSKSVGLLDKSTPLKQAPDSKEMIQGLEKVNQSLNDIKKSLETKAPAADKGLAVYTGQQPGGPNPQQAGLQVVSPGDQSVTGNLPPAQKVLLIGGQAPRETAHTERMRQLAGELATSIKLSTLWNEDLWQDLTVDFKPGKYRLPFGEMVINQDGGIGVHYGTAEDPRGFLDMYAPPVVFDEVQNAPNLLPYIKKGSTPIEPRPGSIC